MKKIYEFPVMWSGWELDNKGWVALDDNGKRVIVLTNHGVEYIASNDELHEKIKSYTATIEATEKALEIVRTQ